MANKHIFEKSAGEKAFWLSNGQKIDNISGLYRVLDNINDEIFGYHVNPERNDFATWINVVFHEKELADNLSKISSKKELKSAIGEWIHDTVRKNITQKKKEQIVYPKKIKVENQEVIKEVIAKKDLKVEPMGSERKRLLVGVVDFILGFIIGLLSMLLYLNMG